MSLDALIRGLKPKVKPYKKFFGKGLYIMVLPTGGKYWKVKYFFGRRERHFSIGVYPEVSPSAALEARDRVKKLIRAGIDATVAKHEAAKLNSKPVSKNLFRFSLSEDGYLSIETDTKLLTLKPLQTQALRSFLIAQSESKEETKHDA